MIFLLTDNENRVFAQDLIIAMNKITSIDLIDVNNENDYFSFLNKVIKYRDPQFRIIYFLNHNKVNFEYLRSMSNFYKPFLEYQEFSKIIFFTRELIPRFELDWFTFIDYKNFYGNIEVTNYFTKWIEAFSKDFFKEKNIDFNDLSRILIFNKKENHISLRKLLEKQSSEYQNIFKNQKDILNTQKDIIEKQLQFEQASQTNHTFNQIKSTYERSLFWSKEWILIALVSCAFIILLNFTSKTNYIFLSAASIICIVIVAIRIIKIEKNIIKVSQEFFNHSQMNDFNNQIINYDA